MDNQAGGLAQLPQFEGQVFVFSVGILKSSLHPTTFLQNPGERGFAVRGVAAGSPDVRWGG